MSGSERVPGLPAMAEANVCREAGKVYLTHMCGRLSGFAKQLEQACQGGFIDIAPAPTGDERMGVAKRTWARDRVLVGGFGSQRGAPTRSRRPRSKALP